MATKYKPINKTANQEYNAPTTVFIKMEPNETDSSAVNRKSNNNNLLVVNVLPLSRVISNPNIDTTTPTSNPPSSTGGDFDYTYAYTYNGTDFTGTPLISTPAPRINSSVRDNPRLSGNDYTFQYQNALNSILFKRFPTFNTGNKILIYPGGIYTDTALNDFVGRGFGFASESVSVNGGVYPNYYRAIEAAKYQEAYNAAQSLPNGDPRKQKLLDWAGPLPAFEGNHLLIDDEETAKYYALYWYNSFKQSDVAGLGVKYFSVNHEVFSARDNGLSAEAQWYRHVGWITKEVIRLSEEDGNPLKSGLTDWGNLSFVAPHFRDDIDSATGMPRYMSYDQVMEPFRGTSQQDPLGQPSDLGALLFQGKAYTGVGRYIQHTMDNQTMFETNPDGTRKVVGGELIWRTDSRNTTINGQDTVIYKDDNFLAMIKYYGLEASDLANTYLRAGSLHLPLSTYRKPGYENIKFSGQFRLDTEVQSGVSPETTGLTQEQFNLLNSRPLNTDWTEANAIRMYFNEDYIRGWMQTQPLTTIGSNHPDIKARASVEAYQKGFQRAADFNWINEVTYRPIEPKLWLKNQGLVSTADPYEAFYRKPIIRGGIATVNGKQRIFIRAHWPCQDVNEVHDVKVWVEKNGVKSPTYTIRLNGRKTYLEWWNLPDNLGEVYGENVYFQFSSLVDTFDIITWRGDYRLPKITIHPTPPGTTLTQTV